MPWNFNDNSPIYQQIIDRIKLSVAVGEYKPGDKLMPVREFAAVAEVNPNTMQKALTELEHQGLLYTQRTAGRFITDDEEKIAELKKSLADEQMELYIHKMSELGYSADEAAQKLKEYIEGGNVNE
jgi:DNA-binding transcriptional regulator YhcF (GntR family)